MEMSSTLAPFMWLLTGKKEIQCPRIYLDGWFDGAPPLVAQLKASGLLDEEHISAWKRIRNRVTHGNLFEPWGTQADDIQLIKLVELLYRLTAIRIGYTADGVHASALSSE